MWDTLDNCQPTAQDSSPRSHERILMRGSTPIKTLNSTEANIVDCYWATLLTAVPRPGRQTPHPPAQTPRHPPSPVPSLSKVRYPNRPLSVRRGKHATRMCGRSTCGWQPPPTPRIYTGDYQTGNPTSQGLPFSFLSLSLPDPYLCTPTPV